MDEAPQGGPRPASRAVRIGGEVTGLRPMLVGMRGLLWPADAWRQARAAARTAFSAAGRTTPAIPADVSSAAQRFEWLRDAQGLTDADLAAMRRTAGLAFTTWFLLASATLVFALVAGRLGLASGGQRLMPWLLVAPALAKAAQWSFWHLQLSRRALVPFRVWARSPGVWVAPTDDLGRKAPSGAALLLAAAVIPMFSRVAWADTGAGAAGIGGVIATMTAPLASGDLSLQWMQHLFPSLWSDATGVTYAQDAVAQLLGTLNVLLTGAAAVMLTLHTLIGLISTAHEGKVLGQRWHQI